MFSKIKSYSRKNASRKVQPSFEALEDRRMFSAAPTLWADDAQGKLFTVNVGTGAVHVIGKMPVVMFDIAYDAHGNLYGIDGVSDLWKINPSNASAKEVGAVGAFVNSLVFSDKGILYAAGSALYSINITTGHGARVGTANLNGYSSAGDLAFDSAGTLYLSTNSNDLVRVNTSTGGAALVGSLGYNQVYGMAYGPNGVLYGLSNSTSQIFSINLATGKGTYDCSFAGKGVDGVNGSTFITEAIPPAPSIEVDGYGHRIVDGEAAPVSADGTYFGTAMVATGSVTRTFSVVNHTAATLHLTGAPRVSITGVNAGDFSVVTLPASSIAPGASSSFTIKFTPHGTGARSAEVTIPNSDPHDGSYHYEIKGIGAVPAPQATIVYAADSVGKLFTVNAQTGATHVIGQMSTVMYDIAFNSKGMLYGVDSQNKIWSINPATAAISLIGSLNVNDNVNSLVAAPDGTLYAAGRDLYAINVTTHAFSDRGYLGGNISAGDLAFDARGQLVMSTIYDQLVVVNPLTAATTLVGPIGYSSVLGLAESNNGVLYGLSDTTDQIFTINPNTGHGSSPVYFSGVSGVFGAAVDPV